MRFALSFAGFIALGACVEQVDAPPAYDQSACRPASLVDVSNGERVVGAEDLAIDRRAGVLFVSAYDRRRVEKAARRGAFLLPEGGVYAVALAALADADGRLIPAAPIIPRDAAPGGLRPHGLDFDPVTNEIAFVNRGYQKIDGRWRRTSRLERVRLSVPDPASAPDAADWTHHLMGSIGSPAQSDAPCAANDVLSIDGAALLSFDHANCGWRAFAEDALGLRRSGIAAERGAPLFDGARFANGVARSVTGEITLAATREKALVFLKEGRGGLAEARRVSLPGGPDNVTVSADGGLVTAVHPSLPWIGAHRHLGLPRAPSRIVKVDSKTLATRLLFEDLRGDHFPGATVAVEADGMLILGSATAPGLLVCGPEGVAAP